MHDRADQLTPARMISVPAELETAIERELATVSSTRWMREAQALSERYRAPHAGAEPLAKGAAQILGYAALIMPATYAQLYGAMLATRARISTWRPTTLLDLGSGPGTALWAATQLWPSLQTLMAWEREKAFMALGQSLTRTSSSSVLRNAHWRRLDLTQVVASSERYDLVVLGHVLNELAPDTQRAVVEQAWQMTAGVLLIVEPGTSAAFPQVRAARDHLLHQGAHTLAPCVHDLPCPLVDDWCHFPQRLKRPPFQKRARGAPSEWEDTKFSYAALGRVAADQPLWGRVIREATWNKAYAEATISARDGVTRYRGLKRHRDTFHLVQDLAWGAALAAPLPAPITPVAPTPAPSVPHDQDG